MEQRQTSVLMSNFKQLEGKMLTLIDASFSDKEQREAQKSLVRNLLWDWYKRSVRTVFPTSDVDSVLSITAARGSTEGEVIDETKPFKK